MKHIRKYCCSIANKWFASHATNFDELIQAVEEYAADLKKMKSKGVLLNVEPLRDGHTELYTYDEALAAELGFYPDPFEEEELEADESNESEVKQAHSMQ